MLIDGELDNTTPGKVVKSSRSGTWLAPATPSVVHPLQRPIHGLAAGDLLNERITFTENIAADIDELVCM